MMSEILKNKPKLAKHTWEMGEYTLGGRCVCVGHEVGCTLRLKKTTCHEGGYSFDYL